jgi:hypothetical protein
VCLPGHDVEVRVRYPRGYRSTEARRQDEVELARQDERRRGDLRKAIRGIVGEADVDLGTAGSTKKIIADTPRSLGARTSRHQCYTAEDATPYNAR